MRPVPELPSEGFNLDWLALELRYLRFVLPGEQTGDPMDSQGSFLCH